jgi:hypothetical protein
MGDDEQATIATLSAYRAVFKDTIVAHQGVYARARTHTEI